MMTVSAEPVKSSFRVGDFFGSLIAALFGFVFCGGPVFLMEDSLHDPLLGVVQVGVVIGFFCGWRYLYKTSA